MLYDSRDDPRPAPVKHNPFNAKVAPRPIGLVGSIDSESNVNLAPFSYSNGIGSEPSYVMFAIGSKGLSNTTKDTSYNLCQVPEFTVSIASYELREQVNHTSKALPHTANEFVEAVLTEQPSLNIRPPRVAEAKAALQCQVYKFIELPGPTADRGRHMVIGEVVGTCIDDEVVKDGFVDSSKLQKISRLGYFEYDVVEQTFEMPRPD